VSAFRRHIDGEDAMHIKGTDQGSPKSGITHADSPRSSNTLECIAIFITHSFFSAIFGGGGSA
jgi:hypothetical protein